MRVDHVAAFESASDLGASILNSTSFWRRPFTCDLCIIIMTHALRVPQIDLLSVLAAPNPHIDLRLDAYESSTRNFLKAVTDYKNHAITEIARRSNSHAAEKKKLADRVQHIESDTNQCKMREIELVTST